MFNFLIKQVFLFALFLVYTPFLSAIEIENTLNEDLAELQPISDVQRVKRSAPTYPELLWPDGIVRYMFEENKFTEDEKSSVRSAMQTLESYANVSFIEKTNTRYSNNHVMIQKGQTCSSSIGSNPIVKRDVTLSNDVPCFRHKILLHELMHTLGFHHEHVRFDRDQYVEIEVKNIKPNGLHNFHKVGEMSVRFGEYDYDSIMHYSSRAYSKDEFNFRSDLTVKPLKEGVKLGYKDQLSAGDIDGLIQAYGPSLNRNAKYIEFKNSAGFNAQIEIKYYYDQTNSKQSDYYSWWGMMGDKKTYTLPSNVDFAELKVSFRSIFDWYDLEYITVLKDDLPICLETWGTLFSPQLSRC
ncbi:M12 family metallopeptidase [Fluviispira vulneris]|uniref:M12 family metallopeptidase n=1 Tax=Fluviispira vulneris TaxID=2763012 RepID=UPI0016445E7E|nr:M12 family metallopeptidase [Fluviispira vulneris]